MGISRWLMMHLLCRWMYSTGSSSVRMCPARVRLISSMMQASVVDLPEPALPVTSAMPRFMAAMRITSLGMCISSAEGSPNRITRTTAARLPRWRNRFTRNRPTPGREKEKSSSVNEVSSPSSVRPARRHTSPANSRVSCGVQGPSSSMRCCRPCIL